MAMDLNRKAQIKVQNGAQNGVQIQDKAQVGALLFDKAPQRSWQNISITATSFQQKI